MFPLYLLERASCLYKTYSVGAVYQFCLQPVKRWHSNKRKLLQKHIFMETIRLTISSE